jgi:WD40-like Beta Propeller Repeat
MRFSCRRSHPGCRRSSALLGATVALSLLVVAIPAQATFYGQDGKIAFQNITSNGSEEIFSINADGSGRTQLTTNSVSDLTPAWSPDATKLAFASNRDGNYEIYTMNADGSAQTRVTNNPADDLQPDWSPDGTKLAFTSSRDGNQEIYTSKVDGTNPVRLTNNSFRDTFPAWSPAGTQIAFQSDRGGSFDIYKMNADGTGQTDLNAVYQNSTDNQRPNWTPSGWIYFDGNLAGYYTVLLMEADGTFHGPAFFPPVGSSPGAYAASPSPGGSGYPAFVFRSGIYRCNSSGPCDSSTCSYPPTTHPGCSLIVFGGDYPDWQSIPYPSYARPRGGTPLRVSLVPAFRSCSAPTSTHGSPLSYPSCRPPVQTSPYLTVGTPDANGAGANSIASVRFDTMVGDPATPADEANVRITGRITDVRCKAGASPCGAANSAGGNDYEGEVQVAAQLQVTDKYNGLAPGGGTDTATGTTTLQVTLPCGASLTQTTVGSTCAITTTADAVYGDLSTAKEGARAIWALGQVTVYDGGSDGIVSTPGGNTVFMDEGVFVP